MKRRPRITVTRRAPGKKRKSCFVLLIGDEGAILVQIVGGKVVNRRFTPSLQAPETEEFTRLVESAPKLPIMVLLDTIDQAYTPQSLPPVTALSVGKLMKKRLAREYPSGDYLRSVLLLGREKSGRKDWNFLMIAQQLTASLWGWLDLVNSWPNRWSGIYMLPLESRQMFEALTFPKPEPKADEPPAPPAVWQMLVAYNKVSGIRQMVWKSGKLQLTRLGQPASEVSVEVIAGSIEQEIIGTKEYLKRFNYEEEEKLELAVVAAEDVLTAIDAMRFKNTNLLRLTPLQLSQELNLPDAAQEKDRYGDVVLGTAIATRRKLRLRFLTPQLKWQDTYYSLRQLTFAAAACGVLGCLGVAGNNGWSIFSMHSHIDEMELRKTKQAIALEELNKKSAALPADLDRIIAMVDIYGLFREKNYNPEPVLAKLGPALREELGRVQELKWQVRPDIKPGVAAATAPLILDIQLLFEFAPALVGNQERLRQASVDMLNGLKLVLPGYEIDYKSLPDIISNTSQLNVDLNQGNGQPKRLEATIIIRGPANLPKPKNQPAAATPPVNPKGAADGAS